MHMRVSARAGQRYVKPPDMLPLFPRLACGRWPQLPLRAATASASDGRTEEVKETCRDGPGYSRLAPELLEAPVVTTEEGDVLGLRARFSHDASSRASPPISSKSFIHRSRTRRRSRTM